MNKKYYARNYASQRLPITHTHHRPILHRLSTIHNTARLQRDAQSNRNRLPTCKAERRPDIDSQPVVTVVGSEHEVYSAAHCQVSFDELALNESL